MNLAALLARRAAHPIQQTIPSDCSMTQFDAEPHLAWSPDSTLLSVFVPEDARRAVHVLNTSLESTFVWHQQGLDTNQRLMRGAFPAWTPQGALIAAVDQADQREPPSYRLDVCWPPAAGCSAEAARLTTLLGSLGADEAIRAISWGPLGGLAVVAAGGTATDTESLMPGNYLRGWDMVQSHRLHVLTAASPHASTAIAFTLDGYLRQLAWSPAGDRLLVNRDYRSFQLLTSSCAFVLRERECCGQAVFSSDGRHVAAARAYQARSGAGVKLQLFSARDGALVFSKGLGDRLPGDELDWRILALSSQGDRLVVTGLHAVHVLHFGWGGKAVLKSKCRQLCDTLEAVYAWASQVEDEG